jgi:hypothetical protein
MTATIKISASGTSGSAQGPGPDAGGSEPSSSGPDVILALSDLIKDTNGEVVLFNDSQFDSLELSADSALIGQGMVERHVTEAGDDVSGFRFVAFANGLKLYYDPDLRVTVRPQES